MFPLAFLTQTVLVLPQAAQLGINLFSGKPIMLHLLEGPV